MYPFGLKHKGYNNVVNGVENNYKTFLGQEITKELGLNWLTFRHRNYMPEIGRFFGVDPVAADYVNISTYQFAHNNPISKIEIEGLEGHQLNGVDVINAPPTGNSTRNPASHIPLPVGNQSGNSTVRKNNRIKASGSTMQAKNGKAHVAKGSVEGSYGPIKTKAEGRVLGASARNTTGDGELNTAVSAGAEASLAEGSIETAIGTKDYNMLGGGRGSVGKLQADIDAGAFTGEGGDVGVKGQFNLGAYTAEGDLSAGISLPGIKLSGSVGGSVLSAHIGGGIDGTINDKTGILTVSGFEHLGFGVGEKASFKVEIDLVRITDAILEMLK